MTRRLMIIAGLLLLSMITLASTARTQAQTQTAHLVINEVFDSQTPSNEFFELYNPTTSDINLSTYVIYNQNGSDSLSRLSPPVIGAGEFLAVPASIFTDTTIGGPQGLQNAADFLGLVQTGTSDTTVDVVNWGPVNPNWDNYQRFRTFFFQDPPTMPAADSTKDLQRFPDGLDTDRGADFKQIDRSPSLASCGDPFEPDNTISSSLTRLDLGQSQLHRICAVQSADQDIDNIRVSFSTTISYTLLVTPTSSLDLFLVLVDGSGNVAATESETNPNRVEFRPTTAGDYYLQISDPSNRTGGRGPLFLYTVALTGVQAPTATPTGSPVASATPTPFCNDAFEPDNDRSQARPLNLGTAQTHTICNSVGAGLSDQDWFTIAAAPGKVYTIFTSEITGGLDTEITVYRSNGEVLAFNDDKATRCPLCSEVNLAFDSVDTYYLLVRDNRGGGGFNWGYRVEFSSQGTPPFTAVPTSTPTIDPNAPTATATLGPCTDAYEQDGTPDSAQLLLIGENEPGHTFCPAGDADWYRIFAGVGKAYTIRTANLGIGVDTYLYLFESDGKTIIAQNDDGAGESVTSFLEFFPLRDAFYYIMVKNKGDLGFPYMNYDLSLAVRANAGNVPVGSPTAIIAPIVTVTSQPTATSQPTTAPTNTPLIPGGNQNTATPTLTTTPAAGTATPTTTTLPSPNPTGQAVILPGAGSVLGLDPTAEPFVPLPATGLEESPARAPNMITVPIIVYIDRNGDGKQQAGEGVHDLVLSVGDKNGDQETTTITSKDGAAAARLVRNSAATVSIPYLRWSGEVVASESGFILRLPAARLPQSIP